MAGVRLDLAHVREQALLPEILHLLLQHLRIADHGGERGAQLVAHVGQELALGAIGFLGRLLGHLKLELGFLAGRDVRMGPDPLAYGTVLLQDRNGAHLHVAPGAVMPPQAVLDLERCHRCDGVPPGLRRRGAVVRMDGIEEAMPGSVAPALAGEARPLGGHAREGPVGIGRPDDRGGRLGQRAEALLALAHAKLGELAQRHVGDDETDAINPGAPSPSTVLKGVEAHLEVPGAAWRTGSGNAHLDVRGDETLVARCRQLGGELIPKGRQQGPDRCTEVRAEAALAHALHRPVHVADPQFAVEEAQSHGRVRQDAVEEGRHALALAPAHHGEARDEAHAGKRRTSAEQGQEEGASAVVPFKARQGPGRLILDGARRPADRVHGALALAGLHEGRRGIEAARLPCLDNACGEGTLGGDEGRQQLALGTLPG